VDEIAARRGAFAVAESKPESAIASRTRTSSKESKGPLPRALSENLDPGLRRDDETHSRRAALPLACAQNKRAMPSRAPEKGGGLQGDNNSIFLEIFLTDRTRHYISIFVETWR